MALVKVCTPSRFTVPKSASASISASRTPPRIAGRARGTPTRRIARARDMPRPRAASISVRDWPRKAERAQSEDVARHREREHEPPLDPAPPRELEERHERGERCAQQQRAAAHADQDPEGRGDGLGEEAGEFVEGAR